MKISKKAQAALYLIVSLALFGFVIYMYQETGTINYPRAIGAIFFMGYSVYLFLKKTEASS